MSLKKIFKKLVPNRVISARFELIKLIALLKFLRGKVFRECNLCGYIGYFTWVGLPPRHDGACKNCLSRERHRLEYLWLSRNGINNLPRPVLHFAPEKILEAVLRGSIREYKTADLYQPSDLVLDIENLNLDSGSQGSVIANHVLEHVDDAKALKELYRVLKNGGLLVLTVPIIEGWRSTYQNPEANTPKLRDLHYGHSGHLRLYGSDFSKRVESAGFRLIDEFIAEGNDVIKYALTKGEKIFIFQK